MPDPYNPWATPIFPGASAFGVGSPAEDAQRQPTIVDNLLSHIAGALGRGFMAPGQALQSTTPITSEQMIAPAQDMSTAMSTGAGAMPASANELRMGIKAYHGSPHDFERFDLSKIGTGEGAQAYGHGLYFADSEGVAKSYRDALSGMNVNGKHLTTGDADYLFMDAARKAAPIDQRTADLISTNITESLKGGHDLGQLRTDLLAQKGNDPNFAKALDAALGQAATATKHPGKMYEVNINADPAHFLDWDKPLSQQHPKVQGGIAPLVEEMKKSSMLNAKRLGSDPTGEQIYSTMGTPFGRKQLTGDSSGFSNKAGSTDIVSQAGIPGIKYLDQGSRGAGQGSSNYVVFNDKLIDILRKYAVPGMMGAPIFANSIGEQKS